jgi:hypothetical protein
VRWGVGRGGWGTSAGPPRRRRTRERVKGGPTGSGLLAEWLAGPQPAVLDADPAALRHPGAALPPGGSPLATPPLLLFAVFSLWCECQVLGHVCAAGKSVTQHGGQQRRPAPSQVGCQGAQQEATQNVTHCIRNRISGPAWWG